MPANVFEDQVAEVVILDNVDRFDARPSPSASNVIKQLHFSPPRKYSCVHFWPKKLLPDFFNTIGRLQTLTSRQCTSEVVTRASDGFTHPVMIP